MQSELVQHSGSQDVGHSVGAAGGHLHTPSWQVRSFVQSALLQHAAQLVPQSLVPLGQTQAPPTQDLPLAQWDELQQTAQLVPQFCVPTGHAQTPFWQV